jgi:hypothetical protein
MGAVPFVSPGLDAERARLMSWAHEGVVPPSLGARLMADPGFAAGARALARGMLEISAADPRVDGIFKDAGRYVAALLAIHLDLQGGLTLARLKAFCERSGFISPSRGRALLLYLRFLRYVEPVGGGGAAGPQRYQPTASFRAAWRVQSAAALTAAAAVEPAAGRVAQALDRPEVFEAFARAHTALLVGSAPQIDQDSAFVRTLMHRNGGSHLTWLLVEGADTTFPPRRPLVIAAAAAARRFGVSRIHVRRMMDAATDAGVLVRGPDGGIAFAEASRGEVAIFFARQLAVILAAAAAALPAAERA